RRIFRPRDGASHDRGGGVAGRLLRRAPHHAGPEPLGFRPGGVRRTRRPPEAGPRHPRRPARPRRRDQTGLRERARTSEETSAGRRTGARGGPRRMSSLNILVFAAAVLSAGVLIGFERLHPYNPGQRVFRPGFFTDLLLYNFVQSYVLGLVIQMLIARIDSAAGGVSRLRLIGGGGGGLHLALFPPTPHLFLPLFPRARPRAR